MSHPSPQSSTGVGPASSPYAGTDPTLYSPELVRNSHSGPGQNKVASIAAGKLPRRDVDKSSTKSSAKSSAKSKSVLIQPAPYVQGAFVNELSEDDKTFISRYQFVAKVPDGTLAGSDLDHELFCVQQLMKLYACFAHSVPFYNRGIFIRFDDLHDSAEGKDIFEQHRFGIEYVSSYDYAIAKGQDTAHINEFEGQIQLPIMIQPNPDQTDFEFTSKDFQQVTFSVEAMVKVFGAVRNCVHVDNIDAKMLLIFRIEYHSADAANRAVQSLRGDPVWSVSVEKHFQWCTLGPALWVGARALNSPHRTKPRVDDRGRLVGYRATPDGQHHLQVPRYRHPHDQHNRVRRERIIDGNDVRTTVMLRNIPNKVDWLSLKAILDDVCFGTFDFVYLRIDFSTACNVGYAFINFADVHGMIALIDHVEHRHWLGFNSSKAAEISYATIQGREALVQKFRNSSVMQETPFCRPRLFLTYDEADATGQIRHVGTEQLLPRPDNISKLQRSMDSARSIGLYPPHGYSQVADHRNRLSIYDRGGPRDRVQEVQGFLYAQAAPTSALSLSDEMKRDVEMWYLVNCGPGPTGTVPFDYIPLTHVTQYLAQQSLHQQSIPGVIGHPVNNGTLAGDRASIDETTPTRGSRARRPNTFNLNRLFM